MPTLPLPRRAALLLATLCVCVVPARLFQDATTANHPGVGFVVPPLAGAGTKTALRPRAEAPPGRPADR